LVGKSLGNYRITQKIGQGGVGEVWKAVDLDLDREVALKILRPELAALDGVVARFRTEALALARLNHPNVATIHGFHTEGGTPFIVMEYIPGQTLHALVRGFGPMHSVRALPLFFAVLDAIEHAHASGIVHRDLKASNVMLSHQGAVKMLDFGIARIRGSVQLTQGPRSMGTPSWMAPEQVRGEEADVRTDVYALGLLLYWLVTARLPFQSDNQFEIQRAHVEDVPPSPRDFAPGLPERIEKAILRALAKQPAERFASAAEMRGALAEDVVLDVTRPFLSQIDETVSRTLSVADEAALDATREPPGPRSASDVPAATVESPIAKDFVVPAPVADDAPTVIAPHAATPERARSMRWLPFAVALLIAALAVAAGLHLLRQPAAEHPTAAPAATAVAPVAPAPATTPPPAPAYRQSAPSPKRKAATHEASSGDDGWAIKRH
jgi:serine/threonine-protein kinase